MVNNDCSIQDIYNSHQERWCNVDMMPWPTVLTGQYIENALLITALPSWKIIRDGIIFTYAIDKIPNLTGGTIQLHQFGWYK